MFRVLVTGADGFIGRYVVDEVRRRRDVVIRYDRPRDVRDAAALGEAMSTADAVIHLAGVLGTEETVGAEANAVDVNILGTLAVLDAAGNRPVVLIGTGHKGQPNPYAITKGAAEDLALSRARWRGAPVTVVRAYHVYGPGQKASPPHGTATVRKVLPSFACRALTGMPLEVWGDGSQLIDLVHASDVAKVLVDAIDGPQGVVLDAGTGHATSVLTAAMDVIKAAGSTSEIRHMPMRVGEPPGETVVAQRPLCPNRWPYLLDETIDHYRRVVTA